MTLRPFTPLSLTLLTLAMPLSLFAATPKKVPVFGPKDVLRFNGERWSRVL